MHHSKSKAKLNENQKSIMLNSVANTSMYVIQ